MNQLDLKLRDYCDNKTPVIVNGIGELRFNKQTGKVEGSKIVEFNVAYLVVEISDDEGKELITIPMDKIQTVSEGKHKFAKTLSDISA